VDFCGNSGFSIDSVGYYTIMTSITDKKTANRSTVLTNGTLGMILFVATEVMFFSGLISSFIINGSDNVGAWPPKWQPRLPVVNTALNTLLLLASGVTMYLAVRNINKDKEQGKISRNLILTMILGGSFVAIQGVEWINLLQAGMTSTSSVFGAFFYTIIGAHGFHALMGVLYLVYVSTKIIKTTEYKVKKNLIHVLSIYWYFVVLLWPVLYVLVYILPSKN